MGQGNKINIPIESINMTSYLIEFTRYSHDEFMGKWTAGHREKECTSGSPWANGQLDIGRKKVLVVSRGQMDSWT